MGSGSGIGKGAILEIGKGEDYSLDRSLFMHACKDRLEACYGVCIHLPQLYLSSYLLDTY